MCFNPAPHNTDNRTWNVRALLIRVSTMLVLLSGCAATLPPPAGADKGLLILSIEAKRNIGSNKPQQLVIVRQQDGAEFSYTSRDGRYYYFANLPEGRYRIKTAAIVIGGNKTTTQSGNLTTSFSVNATNVFPFSPEQIAATETRVRGGSVAFMGSISAEGTAKMFPPGAIEVSHIEIDRSTRARGEAFDNFRKNFAESPWLSLMQ